MTTTRLSTQVSEGTTPTYRCLVVDDLKNALLSVTALSLTICASATRDVINNRLNISILNINGGSFLNPAQVDADGNLYNVMVLLQATDTIMEDPTLDQEYRSAIIEWTYNSGQSIGKHEVQFPITPIRPG